MKKSLIALAIAGAMTAPIVAQADATLYGNVEVELNMGDDTSVDLSADNDADAGYNGAQDADLQLDDAILGVKGSSELENLSGVEAFYQLEVEFQTSGGQDDDQAFNSTDSGSVATRKALVGLKSGFGTVILGRQNILAESIERVDMYAESFSTNQYFAINDRWGNAAAYVTPNFGGFEAYGQIVVEGEGDSEKDDVDAGAIGFNYTLGSFDLAAAYIEMDQNGLDDTMEIYGVGLGWGIGGLQLDATYEATSDNSTGGDDTDMWGVGAAYALGDATVGVTYMDYSYDATDVESDEWGVYATYALGKKASVKAQYSSADVDGNSLSNDDFDKFTLGYNVSF